MRERRELEIRKKIFVKTVKHSFGRAFRNVKLFTKWAVFSALVGVIVGLYCIVFAKCMNFATNFRVTHEWIILFLPLAGCFIVLLYKIFKYSNDKGTNLVLSTIHAKSEVPLKQAPLIFIATVVTHMFGGSAGREGAALQMGGSIGNQLGRWFKFDDYDKRVMVMCGMSAAFSALFGTPMAAAIFAMEVVSVGVMYYAALVPCVFASLMASKFAGDLGIRPERFHIVSVPHMTFATASQMIILSIMCALISVIFCIILHGTGDIYRKYIKNPFIRIIFSSVLIIILAIIFGTDYLGAGINVIDEAIAEEKVVYGAFFLKMIFTALTLEAGFKGGEIVPSFFIGATFGCVFGKLIGLSPSLCAAAGMIAVFCGVTNCPITSMLIAFELFGFEGVPYFLLAVSISYMMSGYYGLYHDQTIVYSKYKTEYINRHTRN